MGFSYWYLGSILIVYLGLLINNHCEDSMIAHGNNGIILNLSLIPMMGSLFAILILCGLLSLLIVKFSIFIADHFPKCLKL
jgi:flagellar biogenesis protein FliO